ncbi:GAF domain-containing protein [Paenibacillus rigui]|uniref:GAF domain-containing protein n=1 Tax=Paenibacillus rigui TaxID=554312 RepID=A0A229UNG6_9BACL|nr:GAF domain-containing protein [Paenibacillus rigui]OXM84903.1 hypothetical protein CF651_18550 [Paenibacillus rigui]
MEDVLQLAILALLIIFITISTAIWRLVHKYRKLQMELSNMNKLLDASIKLNSMMHDPELLLTNVVHTATQVIEAEAASIILKDETTNELYFRSANGEKGEVVKGIRLRMGEGIAGWVAQQGRSLRVDEVQNDFRWSSRVADKTNFETRNLICVPIKTSSSILGVIQVLNKVGGKHFTDQDVKLLEAMTLPTGVALENARMYKQLQKSV